MENEEFNQELLKIWRNNEALVNKYPLFCPELKKNCLLFIGINPSLSDKSFNKMSKEEGIDLTKDDLEYPNKENEDKIIEKAIELERKWKQKIDYFGKFKRIGESIGVPWDHLDLFFYRETSQNDFRKVINFKEKNNKIEMNDFGIAQLNLSIKTIKKCEPKVIVVANALASKILQKYMDISDSSFQEEGFHRVDVNGNKIPIFFSGMLTGQRALDLGSLERLAWHIKKAWN